MTVTISFVSVEMTFMLMTRAFVCMAMAFLRSAVLVAVRMTVILSWPVGVPMSS
jgi:hypothetical protein